MLRLLVAHELRSHLLTYRFAVSLLLLFLLTVSSVTVLALNHGRRLASFAETRRAQEEKLREATDFRTLMWTGSQVEKAPNPLSVFAVGLEREVSRSIGISRSQEAKLGRSKYASPLYTLFPAPDLVYIVNIVGSLLAVLFAFNAISGEQESGTLRLLMSNAVPRDRVLLAKWIGGYVALLAPFLVSVLVAVLIAQLVTPLDLSGADWGAFLGMLGLAALYMSAFFTLSLMISVFTHRAATSLVVAFLVWVLLVLVIPNIAPIAARSLVPVPGAGVIAGQREALQRQAFRDLRDRTRQVSGEQRQQLRDEVEARVADQTGKLLADYQQRIDAQVAVTVTLARLSPSASYVYATAGLAGSGLEDFGGLRQYIDQYRKLYLDRLDQLQQERRRQLEGVTDEAERQEISEAPIDPKALPAFDPGRRALGEAFVSADTDLLLLLLANAVFFLAAYIGFLRYDLMKS
ncbi:MAG: ABC transporter permease subunit [Gemmatimonadota bacterium]